MEMFFRVYSASIISVYPKCIELLKNDFLSFFITKMFVCPIDFFFYIYIDNTIKSMSLLLNCMLA